VVGKVLEEIEDSVIRSERSSGLYPEHDPLYPELTGEDL
jgi:hypothetical protein